MCRFQWVSLRLLLFHRWRFDHGTESPDPDPLCSDVASPKRSLSSDPLCVHVQFSTQSSLTECTNTDTPTSRL